MGSLRNVHLKPCIKPYLAGVVLAVFSLSAPIALGQKTDQVTLIKGDFFWGDIKELNRGLLRLSTDSAGTIYIEWLDIASIHTDKHFNVETASGVRAYGSLNTSEDRQTLDVTNLGRTVRLKKVEVVGITRVKDTFWSRLDGSLGFGFSYQKAKNDIQLNFNASSKYQAQRDAYSAAVSAQVSSQNQLEASERYTGSLARQASFRPKWLSMQLVQLEQNTELDLKLRTVLSAGPAYIFFNTFRSRVDAAGGLALNDERYFTVDKADLTSLEGFASVGYDFFKFNTPKADVSTRFTVYPSLTERGRIRTKLDADLSWEIIKDLGWAITLYLSTDSQPPEAETDEGTVEANGTDYGVTTSLKWTF